MNFVVRAEKYVVLDFPSRSTLADRNEHQSKPHGRWTTSTSQAFKGGYASSSQRYAGQSRVRIDIYLSQTAHVQRLMGMIQACHAAYEVTDETAVYSCTGNPHPSDIEEIMTSMMNDSFETSYHRSYLFLSLCFLVLPADSFFLNHCARDIDAEREQRTGFAGYHCRIVRFHCNNCFLCADESLSSGSASTSRVSADSMSSDSV